MIICPYCGREIKNPSYVCPYCKKPLLTDLEHDQEQQEAFLYENLDSNSPYEIDSERPFDINKVVDGTLDDKIREIEKKINNKYPQRRSEGNLFLEKAGLYYKKRDFPKALRDLENALKIFIDEGNNLKLAITHNEIGLIKEKLGYFEDALYHFDRTIEILKELKEIKKIILMYNNIGNVYLQIKDIENAYNYYQKAINLAAQENLIYEEVKSSSNLVEVLFILKNYDRIKKILQRNIAFFKKNKDYYGQIITNLKYGKLYFYLEERYYDKSFDYLSKALQLIKRIENTISVYIKSRLEWEIYLFLGKIELIWNNYQNAENYLLNSMECVRMLEIDDEGLKEATVLEELARLYEFQRELNTSIEYYHLAITIYDKFGEEFKVAKLNTIIAQLYLKHQHDTLKAIEFFEKALNIYEASQYYKETAKVYTHLGDLYLSKNINDVAISNFKKAKQIYNQLNDSYHIELLNEKINSLIT
jgi:tetratricopeptide (TPR) repeat protein